MANNDKVSVSIGFSNGYARVSVSPPDSLTRNPCDVCCVVDISGSMDTVVDIPGGERSNLTRLDLVKHALKTIIHSLDPKDTFSVVSFSDKARQECTTILSEEGKAKALKCVESLRTEGCTNLWGGLYQGLETLRTSGNKGNTSALLLLTDGIPNVDPPKGGKHGYVASLNDYKDKHPLHSTIHTFGFGYQLESDILISLANEGQGMYVFIPDASILGTAFVNVTSNIMSTLATNIVLALEPNSGEFTGNPLGNHSCKDATWGKELHLGALTYGQTKDIIIPMKYEDEKSLTATLYLDEKDKSNPIVKEVGVLKDDKQVEIHKLRLEFVSLIHDMPKAHQQEYTSKVKDFIAKVKASPQIKDPYVTSLLADLEGQVLEAVTTSAAFSKWGKHYLPSLARAHQLQQCNNFKDPGVQHFGGKLFHQNRDKSDEIFCKLPPPTPTGNSGSYSQHSAPASYNMSAFYSSGGVCFSGSCSILMSDGSEKLVKDIKAGDSVRTFKDQEARVSCVVETISTRGQSNLVQLPGGLLVTPWHPIKSPESNLWSFPSSIAPAKDLPCSSVFSFLLDKDHVVTINGVQCITLAHGISEMNPNLPVEFSGLSPNEYSVLEHPFFGTSKVIQELSTFPGFPKKISFISFLPSLLTLLFFFSKRIFIW